jgi:hypothetical protein
MLKQIQLIYRPSEINTSNITFRLISEAGHTETNIEETKDLKLYLKNEAITVKNFLSKFIEDGMTPVFILKEEKINEITVLKDDDALDFYFTYYLFMPKFKLFKGFYTN